MLLSKTKSAALLENICGKSTNVQIGSNGNCWLGLFTTKPNADGSGGLEVGSGVNYSRVEISDFMTATDRSIVNTADINFNAAIVPSNPDATTGADWGEIVAFGLFTSKTGSTLYAWGDLEESVFVATQNTLHFLTGKFEIYLDEVAASASVSG